MIRARFVAAAAASVLALAGCGGGLQATTQDATEAQSAPAEASAPASTPGASSAAPEPAPEESDPVVDEPVESPSPADGFTELQYGQPLSVSSDDGTMSSTVTVGKPRIAKCQYQSLGCEKPEIGDRVVTVPLLIENSGTETAEWSPSYFVLEFADGTQVEAGDGNALDYQPDNSLGYGQKVRVNGKLKTSLTFEAPKGPFSVLILDSPFDGEPFAAWS
jgi:hypothetical protein